MSDNERITIMYYDETEREWVRDTIENPSERENPDSTVVPNATAESTD
jgi:hypothetical protein